MPALFLDRVNFQQIFIENQLLAVFSPTFIALYLTLFPKFLHQVWFTSLNVDYVMNTVTENFDRHFLVRIGKHMCTSALTNKTVATRKETAIHHHSPSFAKL